MFRPQIRLHQTVYIRSVKGNHTPVVYIYLHIIYGRDLDLICKDIYDCYTLKFVYNMKCMA